MKVLTRLFCASIGASLVLTFPARADYVLYLAGMPLTCANYAGTPVDFSFDTSLADVGMAFTGATPPRVVFNPIVMNSYSPLMQLFGGAMNALITTLGERECSRLFRYQKHEKSRYEPLRS